MATVLELNPCSALVGDEKLYIEQGDTDFFVTPSQLADYVLGNASTAELIRDTIGMTLVAGSGITINADDSPNTITISATGSSAFDAITGGTNTSAAMIVGNGASLAATGTGTIAATSCTGNAATATSAAACSGNAATATALATARAINGVDFNGTAAITVTAAAGTLSGATLAAGVTGSSLTSVGTLTALAVGGNVTISGTAIITSSSATAFVVGPAGATNPALNVDCSTSSSITGITLISRASGNGFEINTTGGTNEALTVRSKGTGALSMTGGSSASIALSLGTTATWTSNQISMTNLSRSATTNTGWLYTLLASGTGGNSLTAGSEVLGVYFNMSAIQTHGSTTAITTQRDMRINPPTHAYQTATGTITDAMGVSIDGAPIAGTNCAITNSHALYIGGRAVGAGVAASYGLTVNPNTGATANYAAQFLGLTGIGRTTPTAYGDFAASTTSNASIRIRNGAAPSAPNDGDMWYDGTDLKFRVASTTKTVTLI